MREGRLVPAILSLAILSLAGLASISWTVSLPPSAVGFYTGWLGSHFSVLVGIFNRGLLLIAWFAALSGQALLWTILMSMGIVDGKGIESLREKYFNSV